MGYLYTDIWAFVHEHYVAPLVVVVVGVVLAALLGIAIRRAKCKRAGKNWVEVALYPGLPISSPHIVLELWEGKMVASLTFLYIIYNR